MAKYFLRTNKTEGLVPLYTRFQRGNSNTIISTRRPLVDVQDWIKANTSVNSFEKFRQSDKGRALFKTLDEIDLVIKQFAKGEIDKDRLFNAIDEIVYREENEKKREIESLAAKEAELFRKEAESILLKKQAEERKILPCLDRFIEGIKNKGIKIVGDRVYKPNTIKAWVSFRGVLSKFYSERSFSWEDINEDFYSNRWLPFLEKEKYMKTTKDKYNVCFKHLIIYYGNGKAHNNAAALKAIQRLKIDEEAKAVEISLSADELQALYKMKLFGLKEQVRDVFLVGCYTAQRFSDYSTIKKEDFGTTAGGNDVIRIKQQKTDKKISIPILSDNLQRILEKYDYNIPLVNGVVLNRYIKQICKELSETVPSLAELVPTVLTMKNLSAEKKSETPIYQRNENGQVLRPRYECVSSHTARRTAITLMYRSHKYTDRQIMSMSGHGDYKTYRIYVKMSEDEGADEIVEASKKK